MNIPSQQEIIDGLTAERDALEGKCSTNSDVSIT